MKTLVSLLSSGSRPVAARILAPAATSSASVPTTSRFLSALLTALGSLSA